MEVFAGTKKIKDVFLGRGRPKALYLGELKIWPTDVDVYLRVSPEIVWLSEGNGYSATFEVQSNTMWNVG